MICGIAYLQHNSPENFLKYIEEAIEKYSAAGKNLCLLGDSVIYVYKESKIVIIIDFTKLLSHSGGW